MCHGPGVLGELVRAQVADVRYPLHPAGLHVGGEFLVAEDRQSLLQGKLKPVAAGDPVAGPVVEVFVADYLLDCLEVIIRGRGGAGEDIA